MPVDDCPFVLINHIPRPYLGIKIINPHTNKSASAYGLIDTGADECAIPAGYASLLGHNLLAGKTKLIGTGNGTTTAYSHTIKFELYHPLTGKLLHTISETPIDFMPNLRMVLLGVNSFLSNFVLKIDYPEKTFSIKHP
ncbi:MAG: hypothetical protein ACC651_12830 [Candidatus Scalindua sp.]